MRLIDADELKKEVLKWMPSDPCGIEEKEHPFETNIVVSLMMEIEDAPSIDICFCEECMFSDEEPITDGRYWCALHQCFMRFCNNGKERK
jgi:hypothetical protein